MTDDELDELSGRMAAAALSTTGDAFTAGRVLFQAMTIILASRLGGSAASDAIRNMANEIANGISALPDITETRQ